MRIIILILNCLLVGFCACSGLPFEVQQALNQAGTNRAELENVINHYKKTGEKQKLEAAYFLIANMPGKYSEYYNYNEQAYEIFSQGKSANKDNRIAFIDSLSEQIDMIKDLAGRAPMIVWDIETLTSGYLIENIEWAFKAWQEPWSRHFSFDEFCEYILPYRVRNEPISNWRKQLYEKYYWVKNSIKHISDPSEVTLCLNDTVAKDFWTLDELDMPFVPIPLLEKAKAGGCDQRYVLMISLLRAMGIPAMMDYAPQHNNTFKSHSWMVYLDSLHRYRPCDGGRIRGKIFLKDNLKSSFPTGTVIPLADGFGSNVFRYTYAINKESLAEQISDKRKIPAFFRNSCIKDVSGQYIFDMHALYYDASRDIDIKDDLAYLAVFGYSEQIREAAYTNVKDSKMEFAHVGSGIVYLICAYKNGELVPFSHPILMRNSGAVDILVPDTLHRQKMILTRKCKESLLMQGFAESMVGGRFEGCNSVDWSNPDILYEINDSPYFLVEQEIRSDKTYRYVRYISPHNGIFVAELQFWGKDEKGHDSMLQGNPMMYMGKDSVQNAQPKNAFDNDIRTNFNAPSGSWIGMDLKAGHKVCKIKYLSRNNFNVIEVGNKYELMYYHEGWKSLGIQTATKQFLEFDDVPVHALFLLKNLTQGKEERIFTYENNRQMWW